MLAFFRFLRGYLRICVTGYSPERFMNLCCIYGICLWNIEEIQAVGAEKEGENDFGKVMNISVRDFFKLGPIAKKTKTRIHIQKKQGFPFFLQKVQKRKVFAAGLLSCLFLLFLLSKFIWAIDLEGNQTLTEDIFCDFLEENQVFIGMPIGSLDIDQFEKNLRSKYTYITWASAKVMGTRLMVSVKENTIDTETIKSEQQQLPLAPPTDLLAQEEGVIVSMITRKGVPVKKIGDQVKKGEVLVSGMIPITNDDATVREYQYCNADAEVVLETLYSVEEKLPYYYCQKQKTGKTYQRRGLRVGNFFYEIGHKKKGRNWEAVQQYKQLKLLENFFLPVYFGKTVYTQYEVKQAKYPKTVMESILKDKFVKYEESLIEKGVQIIEKDVKIVQYEEGLCLKGTVRVQLHTGKSASSELMKQEEIKIE